MCISDLYSYMGGMVCLDEEVDMEAGRMGKQLILKVDNLTKNYQKQLSSGKIDVIKVLRGLNFEVDEGDFLGIMGKSGCGKTTLLKVLGLIDSQSGGNLHFMEKDIDGLHPDEEADIRRKRIGFIFQDFYLMDCLTVEENIMLPMILNKEKSDVMHSRAAELARQFQIDHLLENDPYELSGGEKQRVAICRALVNNPDLILADEPTGNLDSKSGKIVIDALTQVNQDYGKTVVMVTHDPKMAGYCKNIILLKDGMILETLEKKGGGEEFYYTILDKMSEL